MSDIDTKLLAYCDEVLRFRKVLNLTSIDHGATFMQRFVTPSLALQEWLPASGRLLDIGSGMGIPGIPLLLQLPGLQGVLVERRKKRAEFLRHLVRLFEIDAEVYDADIVSLPHLAVDMCVARAVMRADALLALSAPHCNNGAVAILPVPRESSPVDLSGWQLIAKGCIKAGDQQNVQCYKFSSDSKPTLEICTHKEGVSRET